MTREENTKIIAKLIKKRVRKMRKLTEIEETTKK